MSSAAVKEDDTMLFCASCGTAGGDDITLKKCTACYLVRYCSVKCQREHRPKHKRECKKRAAELHDELLFKQPESSHMGDCPICCLPLPIVTNECCSYACCSKFVCKGCAYANAQREFEGNLQRKCPFCRKALPNSNEESDKRSMKRVEANDAFAMFDMGTKRLDEGDYKAAFEYFTKAATLGDAVAHYQLSIMYHHGTGVEKDRKREWHHAEQAAIGGHAMARHNLACLEGQNGQPNRAAKHFIIAAKLGHVESLERIEAMYKAGYHVSKDDFDSALRGHQAAIAATISPQREEATKFGYLVGAYQER